LFASIAPFALLLTASAAEIVFYDTGEAADAKARVSVAASRPFSSLQALTLAELAQGRPPALIGPGAVTACSAAAVDGGTIDAAIQRAESSIDYLEYAAAWNALNEAAAQLGCLSAPLAPGPAARLHFLSGVVANALDDKPSAWTAFRQARIFQPDITWDENFPPDARPMFDAAGVELASTPLVALSLAPQPGEFWIDGRALPPDAPLPPLLPGAHVIQFGKDPTTLTVTLEPDADVTLVLPALIPPDGVSWSADPDLRPALAAAVTALLPRDAVAFFALTDAVWRLDGGEWTEFSLSGVQAALPPEPPPAEPPPAEPAVASAPVTATSNPTSGPRLDRIATLSGGALVLGGGALALVSHLQARTAWVEIDNSETRAAWNAANTSYESAGSRTYIGMGIAGAGLLTSLTGLLLLDSAERWFIGSGPGGGLMVGVNR